nr:MAG TPA: hypothetical protein [Caudoviricetes sp.]
MEVIASFRASHDTRLTYLPNKRNGEENYESYCQV